MSENKVEDYVPVRAPIKPMMTRIINDMKGEDRTMADFAFATGVSTSMLSRIVNGNYTKPISTDILQKIASNAAPECALGLKDLLEANGMMTKEAANHFDRFELQQQMMINRRRRDKDMRDVITNELFIRGIAIKKVDVHGKERFLTIFGCFGCDLTITLPDQPNLTWFFDFVLGVRDEDDYRKSKFYVRRIIDRYAAVFLQDAWEPESTKDDKFSIVFADKTYFEQFIDALRIAKFNNRVSAILIDLKSRKVVAEHNFACKNFPASNSLFEQPALQEEYEIQDTGQLSFLDKYSEEEDE